MKTILVTLVGVVLFAPAASARHMHPSGAYASVVPNNPRPSGARLAIPNSHPAYWETRSGWRVNPYEVPPLSPWGAVWWGPLIVGLGS